MLTFLLQGTSMQRDHLLCTSRVEHSFSSVLGSKPLINQSTKPCRCKGSAFAEQGRASIGSLRKCTKSKTKQVGSIRAYQHTEALQEIQGFFNSLIWAHNFTAENQTQQDLDCEIWSWPSNQLEPELITKEVSYFATVVLFMDKILH